MNNLRPIIKKWVFSFNSLTLDVCFLYYYKNDDQEIVLHWMDKLKSVFIAETKDSK